MLSLVPSGSTYNVAKRVEAAAHQHEPGEADQEPLRERNVAQTFKHGCVSLQNAVGQGDLKRLGNVLRSDASLAYHEPHPHCHGLRTPHALLSPVLHQR